MAGGRCADLEGLPDEARAILTDARRGILASKDLAGRPHAVPVCYAVRSGAIVTPIDAKPKSGRTLGRRRNLQADPRATFLVDRWSEDWSQLGWVMVRGTARFLVGDLLEDVRARYQQYRDVFVGDDAILVEPEDVAWWLWEELPG